MQKSRYRKFHCIYTLTEVLNRLRSANLKLNPKKCHLFQRKVTYLGYIVGQDGIETDPSKTRVIQDWPIPTNISELRSFLGLCSYYRRFVKDFAKTASPLNKMLSKDVKFEWTNDCQIAWETLKHCLVTAPILSYPCSEGNFILDTDMMAWERYSRKNKKERNVSSDILVEH
jgi:hypothetical protein